MIKNQISRLPTLVGTSSLPIPDGRRLAKQPFLGAKEIDDQSLIKPMVRRPGIRLLCGQTA
jgi:hypothetical protein